MTFQPIRISTLHYADFKNVFLSSFTDSEGKEEGTSICKLVDVLLKGTPKEDVSAFAILENTQLIGGVCFSRLFTEQGAPELWMLSPMAVLTSHQGKGVGQALIRFAHRQLKEEGVRVVVTYGDINFYGRLGFEQITEEVIPAPHKLSYP